MLPNVRTLVLGLSFVAAAACTQAPSASEGMPPAFEATSPPPAPPGATDAYHTLETARVFEDAHVGLAGSLSRNAEAFRAILAAPEPKLTMRALYTEGTLVGKLYAIAGLYLVDPEAFEPAARALAKRGGTVQTRQGCMGGESSVAEVIFATGPRIMVAHGKSLNDWFAQHPSGAMGDIAGGYVPLRLATEEMTQSAPREPLTL